MTSSSQLPVCSIGSGGFFVCGGDCFHGNDGAAEMRAYVADDTPACERRCWHGNWSVCGLLQWLCGHRWLSMLWGPGHERWAVRVACWYRCFRCSAGMEGERRTSGSFPVCADREHKKKVSFKPKKFLKFEDFQPRQTIDHYFFFASIYFTRNGDGQIANRS